MFRSPVPAEPFSRRQPEPWAQGRGLEHVLAGWRSEKSWPSFVLDETLPASEGQYAPLPASLGLPVRTALEARGIERLYRHQAEAFDLVQSGCDVVVATPTASGKSLAYHLPVLERLRTSPDARAMYMFPTKALARDQEASLCRLMRDAGLSSGAVAYDGDTPQDARRAARERSSVVITNPDMLHTGILPHHASWARFFANLSVVVIDELHTYRGVFGSHLANVLRRLERIVAFHGAKPVYVFSSATIGNPRAHASALLGRDVASVDESGAPIGRRRLLVYNPPVVNQELGIRASYTKSAVRLASDLVRAEVATIVFGQSRNQVEVMLKYLRDRLRDDGVDPELIQGYRGGYLADTRRRIENGLREGDIRCVVATSALELGIDIGALDAVVCAGYPGSMAALWQRFGRGGRRRSDSLALLVTSSAPLDQFLARAPRYIVEAPVEQARIDPDNIEILLQHLKCASFELPFASADPFGGVPGDAVGQALDFLAGHEVVHPVAGPEGKKVYHWASDAYPANHVSLRTAGWDNFAIIDVERTKTIAEMDFYSTHTMLHEQAIYQQDGEQYQVERLDFENHKAYVRRVEPDYFTTALTHVRVNVLLEERAEKVGFAGAFDFNAALGEVNVIEKVVGFKKIKFHTHENVGYGEIQLPEIQMPTTAFWLTVPHQAIGQVHAPRARVIDALRGLAHAMHAVAAVGLMMDPHDLGRALVDVFDRRDAGGFIPPITGQRPASNARSEAKPSEGPAGGFIPPITGQDQCFDPTIYLYDHVAGGIGLAPRLFEEREDLLRRAEALIAGCACEEGCPACVGPMAGIEEHHGAKSGWSVKRLALELLGVFGLAPAA